MVAWEVKSLETDTNSGRYNARTKTATPETLKNSNKSGVTRCLDSTRKTVFYCNYFFLFLQSFPTRRSSDLKSRQSDPYSGTYGAQTTTATLGFFSLRVFFRVFSVLWFRQFRGLLLWPDEIWSRGR